MRAPAFWAHGLDPKSREAAPLTRLLLTPLTWAYQMGFQRKLSSAQPQSVDAKVLCVGNLTLGGAGKTPLVAKLRALISETYGLRCASLSRGHAGKIKTPTKVQFGYHGAAEVGDEALMLAGSGEAWIGKDRAAAAAAMSADGVEVIIMDDGHQNPTLEKDLSLIVIDPAAPFGNGHLFPKGPLREPVKAGLARADAILLLGQGPCPPDLSEFARPILTGAFMPDKAVPEGPHIAFAGIGRPQKFFDTLIGLGTDLRDAIPFPDHYVYKPHDLKYLRALASDHGAKLITTEKDFARLDAVGRADIEAYPVHVVLHDEVALHNLLDPILGTVPHG